jgi:hypothetical protein
MKKSIFSKVIFLSAVLERTNLFAFLFIILCLLFISKPGPKAQCLRIESILVDACAAPEGENEMIRFRVGNQPIRISGITFRWPNNSWREFCEDASLVRFIDSLNQTPNVRGLLKLPTNDILPARANVLLITSTKFIRSAYKFGNLCDTAYVLFQCEGNVNGHFANSGAGTRSVILQYNDGSLVCADTATYAPDELKGGNGARVDFPLSGGVIYQNEGCNALVASVSAFKISSQRPLPLCKGESTVLSVPSNWRVQWFKDGIAYVLGNNALALEPGKYVAIGITPDFCIPRVAYDTMVVTQKIIPPPSLIALPRCGQTPAIFLQNSPLGTNFRLNAFRDAGATQLVYSALDTRDTIIIDPAPESEGLYFQRRERNSDCVSEIVYVASLKKAPPLAPAVRSLNPIVCKDGRASFNIFLAAYDGKLNLEIQDSASSTRAAVLSCDSPPCLLRYTTSPQTKPGIIKYRFINKDPETGCQAVSYAELTVSPPLAANWQIDAENCNAANIAFNVSGGAPPYRYALGNRFQTEPIFANILPGEHPFIITDAANCIVQGLITVPRGCGISAEPQLTSEPNGRLALHWGQAGFCVNAINLKLRPKGQSVWQSITLNPNVTSYSLQGLIPETEYEVELELFCPSSFTSTIRRATIQTPICNAPNFIFVQNVTSNNALARWSAMDNADFYNFSHKNTNIPDWPADAEYVNPNVPLVSLLPGNTYEIRARSICYQGSVISSYVYNTFTTLAGRFSISEQPSLFKLYPNPSKGQFKIVLPEVLENECSFQIFDLSGKKVWESLSVAKGEKEIEMEAALNPGIYIYTLTAPTSSIKDLQQPLYYTGKLIIE